LLLYIDADSIVMRNVDEMVYDFLNSGKSIGIALENTPWFYLAPIQASWRNNKIPEKFFPNQEKWKNNFVLNSGLILAHGKKARELGDAALEIYDSCKEFTLHAEQTILNSLIYEKEFPTYFLSIHQHCFIFEEYVVKTKNAYIDSAYVLGMQIPDKKIVVRHFAGKSQEIYSNNYFNFLLNYYLYFTPQKRNLIQGIDNIVKVLTITNNLEKTKELCRSLIHFGWDFEVIYRPVEKLDNILKLHILKEYLEENNIDGFIFLDASDVFALDTPENTIPKLKKENLISAEANCQNGALEDSFKDKHPKTDSVFKYVNSGMYYMKKDLFLELCKEGFDWAGYDDQGWLMKLTIDKGLNVDHKAEVFLNMAFNNEFFIKGGEVHTTYGTKPAFIQGNGQLCGNYNMGEIYKLI
jgi:hypothetical protein